MPKWIVNLTDEDKEGLERIRVYLGLKSHAEAFRAILRKFDGREEPLNHPPMADVVSKTMRSRAETIAELPPAQQMTERELRDAFWRKTGVFNPKGKTR